MAETPLILETTIPNVPVRRGKVRDIYDLGDELLLVATDRISAFDVVMANGIPHKGAVLTAMSCFWFDRFADLTDHHLIEPIHNRMPKGFEAYADQLRDRSLRVKKTEVVPIEAVVRGYLAGSGWKEYQADGTVCGIRLPKGLRQSEQLPEPIFTPATKAETGHDENVSFDEACRVAGRELMTAIRDRSIALYQHAAEYARKRGLIIADTKFEWGRLGDDLILIDEVLTPDSSRFWPADDYKVGRDQVAFDKQFVRNYLESIGFNKQPPGPVLPDDVVAKTTEKYLDAYERLTGRSLL
ncbi:MAG: phosphoribosylaminoimidazolesuccinocarboxamide synthase [Phycisphaerae bacterium]|nr:phosphoribosylaminoimidazolesuccinocarboxamide synthase [Phycisphaerae bacterium]